MHFRALGQCGCGRERVVSGMCPDLWEVVLGRGPRVPRRALRASRAFALHLLRTAHALCELEIVAR